MSGIETFIQRRSDKELVALETSEPRPLTYRIVGHDYTFGLIGVSLVDYR